MPNTETETARYEVTNLNRKGARAYYNAAGRVVTLGAGETRVSMLTADTAARLDGTKALRVRRVGAGAEATKEADVSGQTATENNPVAIEALLAKVKAGEITWPDLRKEADVFLSPTPSTKAEIIDALKARADELRQAAA